MSVLLAHHLEPQHFPVLLCLFAAGFYIGWHALSRWLVRGDGVMPGRAGD
jgi:hypothetical protein